MEIKYENGAFHIGGIEPVKSGEYLKYYENEDMFDFENLYEVHINYGGGYRRIK